MKLAVQEYETAQEKYKRAELKWKEMDRKANQAHSEMIVAASAATAAKNNLDALLKEDDEDEEEGPKKKKKKEVPVCKICLEDKSALLTYNGCGHRCICKECADKQPAKGQCAICKLPYTKIIPIYDS